MNKLAEQAHRGCIMNKAPALCFQTWFSLAMLALTLSAARAQYSIDWFSIDGGGGASTGGIYSVSGTVGQPDAGTMSGGPFALHGGFWSIVAAVQTPGAPLVAVLRTTTNTVVVSWPASADNWRLQFTSQLSSGNSWTEIAPPYQTASTNLIFVEPAPAGSKFYRLQKQ